METAQTYYNRLLELVKQNPGGVSPETLNAHFEDGFLRDSYGFFDQTWHNWTFEDIRLKLIEEGIDPQYLTEEEFAEIAAQTLKMEINSEVYLALYQAINEKFAIETPDDKPRRA